MNFLLCILLWLFGTALGNYELNECRNNTSGDKGVCLFFKTNPPVKTSNLEWLTVDHNLRNTIQIQLTNDRQEPPIIDSTFYLQKPVQVDLSHNLQKVIKVSAPHYLRRPLLPEYDHDLRKPVRVHVTNDLRKSVQTDRTFYLQEPVQVDPSHNVQEAVKISSSHDLRWSAVQESDHDLRKSVQVHATNDLHKPVQTNSTFYLQKSVQVDSSHDLRKPVKVEDSHDLRWPTVQEPDHNLRNPVQVHGTFNLRKPVQTDSTFYLQKSVQVDSSYDLRKAVKISESHDLRRQQTQESDHDLRNPVQVHATFNLRKPVQTYPTFYLQKPLQVDSSHNLRKPVKVADSHDLRRPILQELDHDLRNPVQVHATFNLRKLVQTDPTFYLQKPVQVDPSHDLRKPVKVSDSHDLRWPIVQEPDHDLRNPVAEIDFFRSENAETILDKIIQAYAKKASKDDKNKENYDPIYELLHEDNHIKSNCALEFWSQDSSTSENRTRLKNLKSKTSQQKILFRNSTKTCGIPYNDSTENLDFQTKNSNLGSWMVSVQEYFFGKFRHKCGGSLLNNLWVITAAHCVDLRPKWDFLLKLGTENNGEPENLIERLVNKISVHPKYNNINFDNDVALLRMERPVTFQYNIVPICLPDTQVSMERRKAAVFGWQITTRREPSTGAVQAETVPVLTNKECEVMFSETGVNESIEKNFVCAGTRSVKESCTGDSGGPLAVLDDRGRWSLAGLYSWGKSCKIPNQPEVYISIASYVNWIEDTITCFEHYINLGRMDS